MDRLPTLHSSEDRRALILYESRTENRVRFWIITLQSLMGFSTGVQTMYAIHGYNEKKKT